MVHAVQMCSYAAKGLVVQEHELAPMNECSRVRNKWR